MLTYVIGDIHGQARHLDRMLERIAEHAGDREHTIICIGDYVSRGILAKEALDLLMARPHIITLMGNHEGMLLDAVAGHDADFYYNGGMKTLESFCVDTPKEIPQEYIDFIAGMPFSHSDERRFYVHAGIDPAFSLENQRPWDMVWMREPFLGCRFRFEKYIVHGHTVTESFDLEVHSNRCNVDAGCYASGRLVCAVFDDTQDEPIDKIMVTNARRVPM